MIIGDNVTLFEEEIATLYNVYCTIIHKTLCSMLCNYNFNII